MHGTSDNLFDSYLQEYMWKKQHKDNIFGNILYCISFYYSTEVNTVISSMNEREAGPTKKHYRKEPYRS